MSRYREQDCVKISNGSGHFDGEGTITTERYPRRLSRRQFLGLCAASAPGLWLAACVPIPAANPEMSLFEEIRRAANAARAPVGGIGYDPNAAFPPFARAHALGMPWTQELETRGYRFQGYAYGIVYAPVSVFRSPSGAAETPRKYTELVRRTTAFRNGSS
jgi:hypothetical protein